MKKAYVLIVFLFFQCMPSLHYVNPCKFAWHISRKPTSYFVDLVLAIKRDTLVETGGITTVSFTNKYFESIFISSPSDPCGGKNYKFALYNSLGENLYNKPDSNWEEYIPVPEPPCRKSNVIKIDPRCTYVAVWGLYENERLNKCKGGERCSYCYQYFGTIYNCKMQRISDSKAVLTNKIPVENCKFQ